MKKENKYIYPVLPAVKDLYIFRLGGSGLANCLFIYARAIIAAEKNKKKIISPTWFNLSLSTYIRAQSDKRHYNNIFLPEVSFVTKLFNLFFKSKQIEQIKGMGDYFTPLKHKNELVKSYIYNHLNSNIKAKLPCAEKNVIAVHVRLGDYPEKRRTPVAWYKKIILAINKVSKEKYEFQLFSDGTEKELKQLTELDFVKRKNYGSAIADIWAVSQSKLIIGSDSTFSAWGAYLNQVPIIFYKRHFPSVLDNQKNEIVVGNVEEQFLPWFKQLHK